MQVQDFIEFVSKIELHVAMEYSVPHLGHNSSLMFGGLGKMVDIFIRYADRFSWPFGNSLAQFGPLTTNRENG